MTNKLGLPSFFITLTQNDNWSELQAVVKYGPYSHGESFNINHSSFLKKQTNHCLNNSVDTCIAFNQRFDLFKQKFLKNTNSPIGKVVDFWY